MFVYFQSFRSSALKTQNLKLRIKYILPLIKQIFIYIYKVYIYKHIHTYYSMQGHNQEIILRSAKLKVTNTIFGILEISISFLNEKSCPLRTKSPTLLQNLFHHVFCFFQLQTFLKQNNPSQKWHFVSAFEPVRVIFLFYTIQFFF